MIKNFFKKIYITKEVSSLVNFIGSPWKGRGAILMYLRILPDERIKEDLNLGLAVSCSNFENQIKMMKSKYKLCSMDEFLNNLKKDKNEFMLTITFDDGYKDNLTYVLPILIKYNVPATIYISTRFLEGDTWMWWYEIWDYLNDNIENKITDNDNILSANNKTKMYRLFIKKILNLSYSEQLKFIEEITHTRIRKQYEDIVLSWDQVIMLDNNKLITIGAHTHSHPNLRMLSDAECFNEITYSKNLLEERLNHPVDHFAYPFGSNNEAGEREFITAERAGFKTSVTTRVDKINSRKLHAIPRISVPSYLTTQGLVGKVYGWEVLITKIMNIMMRK